VRRIRAQVKPCRRASGEATSPYTVPANDHIAPVHKIHPPWVGTTPTASPRLTEVISCGRQRILRRLAEQWGMRDSLEYVSFRWITYGLTLFLGPIVLVTVALVTPDPLGRARVFVTIVVICVVGVLLTLRFVVEE
jgi:hypothetical protein